MRRISRIIIFSLGLIAATYAHAHPATERYIPIGDSPGISKVKSYIGPIQSLRHTADGFTMSVGDEEKTVLVTEVTKIYLDTGRGRTNTTGTEADCEVGRQVEVYLHEDGTAYWVKIKVN